MTWIAGHRKAIAGFLSALGGICAVIAVHQEWGQVAQWAGIAVAVLGAAGVYQVRNTPAVPASAATPPNMTITRPAPASVTPAPVAYPEQPPPDAGDSD